MQRRGGRATAIRTTSRKQPSSTHARGVCLPSPRSASRVCTSGERDFTSIESVRRNSNGHKKPCALTTRHPYRLPATHSVSQSVSDSEAVRRRGGRGGGGRGGGGGCEQRMDSAGWIASSILSSFGGGRSGKLCRKKRAETVDFTSGPIDLPRRRRPPGAAR